MALQVQASQPLERSYLLDPDSPLREIFFVRTVLFSPVSPNTDYLNRHKVRLKIFGLPLRNLDPDTIRVLFQTFGRGAVVILVQQNTKTPLYDSSDSWSRYELIHLQRRSNCSRVANNLIDLLRPTESRGYINTGQVEKQLLSGGLRSPTSPKCVHRQSKHPHVNFEQAASILD